MKHRVSGTLCGVEFTGTLLPSVNDYKKPYVEFDVPILAPDRPGLDPHTRVGIKLAEYDGLVFHERQRVYLGEFLLGYLVERDGKWYAEPINHSFLNPDGKPGTSTEPYNGYLEAFKFFHYSLPIGAREHLRVLGQTAEHETLARYKK